MNATAEQMAVAASTQADSSASLHDTHPRACTFGPEGNELFGFYHAPDPLKRRGCGVVLCAPFGYEAMCTHRSWRYLATSLAHEGFSVLRFDYPGTGDSAGENEDPDRVEAWSKSIGHAIDHLRTRGGDTDIALLGMRLGAMLAMSVAAHRGDITSLVLWAPSRSGKAYVREMQAFRRLKEEAPGTLREGKPGDEEVAGFLLAAPTIADISAIDLLAVKEPQVKHALVLARDDIPSGEERLGKHLTSCGVACQVKSVPGYAAMMQDALVSIVPEGMIRATIDFLGEAHPLAGSQEDRSQSARQKALESSTTLPSWGEAKLRCRSRFAASALRERAQQFADDGHLFGIVTEPVDPVPYDRPAVVFLNVGSNHHIGPNRMSVLMAREAAARGFLAFRFDVSGIGDSRPSPDGAENKIYSKRSVLDVQAAMAHLAREHGSRKFVLVGLCSGAYLAYHTADVDERVVGQILLNPQTFVWKEGDSLQITIRSQTYKSTRFYKSAVLKPEVWRRLLRGQINVRGITEGLTQRGKARAIALAKELLARLQGQLDASSNVLRTFRKITERGTDSLLLFCDNDGGLDMIELHLGSAGRKLRARKNFTMEVVEGPDHTFTPLWSQNWLYRRVTDHITQRFGA